MDLTQEFYKRQEKDFGGMRLCELLYYYGHSTGTLIKAYKKSCKDMLEIADREKEIKNKRRK
jgi:hypothetical protein